MKIVILGSCKNGPYDIILVPKKEIDNNGKSLWNTEKGYQQAFKKFSKAIKEADEVWVYLGDHVGEHTLRDYEYAKKLGKTIKIITEEYSYS
jgi:hypothetical protein